MDQQPLLLAALKKAIGIRRIKGVAPVDLAGGQTVAEHLRYIPLGHFHTGNSLAGEGVVRPVFEVMAVAALVVKPGGTVPVLMTLRVIGTVISLIVPYAGPKFHRSVFGQVVSQSLPVQSQPEAVFAHQSAVAANGSQMGPEMQNGHLELSNFFQYSILRKK